MCCADHAATVDHDRCGRDAPRRKGGVRFGALLLGLVSYQMSILDPGP